MSPELNTLSFELLAAAEKFPGRPALVAEGEAFSYEQLKSMATVIVTQLKEKEAGPVIGVYYDGSAWSYAAILAVFLCGGCYVPFSNQLPEARLNEMVRQCKPGVVISREETRWAKTLIPGKVDLQSATPTVQLFRQKLAYILFTSGSTGSPKGVPVSFSNLACLFSHFDSHCDFCEEDRFLQPFDPGFDMSLFAILLAWRAGACVCAVPSGGFKPLNILATIRDQRITVAPMVPTVLSYAEKYLDELVLGSLRYTFFAGDRLSARQAGLWQLHARDSAIYNCYGPTEATMVCTWHKYDGNTDTAGDVPIGKVFARESFLILDESGESSTSSGELCLTGGQVIAGYLNDAEDDRFIKIKSTRYYRTGDKVCINAKGELEFIGRLDNQVKVMGHRVEPGEVERHLESITGRRVVVVPAGTTTEKRLIAFVEGRFDKETVASQLSELLPQYMVPSLFVQVAGLPLSPAGKVDVRRLLEWHNEQSDA